MASRRHTLGTQQVEPPLLVRASFFLGLPVPRPWRAWAYQRIEGRYAREQHQTGATAFPGRDFTVIAVPQPAGRRIGMLRQNELDLDGSHCPAPDKRMSLGWLSDPVLRVLPVLLLFGAVVIVIATVVVASLFT